jgi:hypothetical protein
MFGNNQQNSTRKLLWFGILVWFSSSLMSQALYMGFYGMPYDAIELLGGVGPVYYLLIIIELSMWALLAALSFSKVMRRVKLKTSNVVPSLGK